MNQKEIKEGMLLAGRVNDVLLKLGYKWKPEPGDIFEYRWREINTQYKRVWHKEVVIVPFEFQTWADEDGKYMAFGEEGNYQTRRHYFLENCIVLLHWEKLQSILEKIGFGVCVRGADLRLDEWEGEQVCTIIKPSKKAPGTTFRIKEHSKKRQEAVQKAIVRISFWLKTVPHEFQ